ncbi:hypothetical protein Tsubulata_030881, partial [Turnera subulata]
MEQGPSNRTTKMPKGKDPFWDHVDEVDGRWKCKYCEQSFSLKVSVSRVKFHLAGESARGVEVCKNAPTVVQLKALEAILSKRQKVMSPVPTNDQGQASVSQEMEVDTPTLEQLEILNRMTTDMLQQPQGPENPLLQEHVGDVLEIPSVPVENDALNTSWENTAGQMQPDFTRMPSSSNNEAGSTFPIQAEDWERYFNEERPFLQSLTLEDQVPRAQVMPSSSNEEVRIADPTSAPTQTTQENPVDQQPACDNTRGLPKLRMLVLDSLPQLKRICNGLPKLRKLELDDLPQLKCICNGVLVCESLQIVVIRCPKLHEIPIIAADDEAKKLHRLELSKTEIRLPKLKALTLRDLPNLTSIYSGLLICDSLEYVTILKCGKLKRIPISLPLQSLKRVEVSPDEWWEQVEWGQIDWRM